MRLILACTDESLIKPGVLEAVRASGHQPEIRPTPGPFGYWEMLNEVWGCGEDLFIIEQDVLIRPECIDELAGCEEDWCKFPYWYPPFGYYGGFGCTRFSQFCQGFVPNALSVVGKMHDDRHPPKHWCRLDAWLQRVLMQRGMAEHYHYPPIEHLGGRQDNRCMPGVRSHDVIPLEVVHG